MIVALAGSWCPNCHDEAAFLEPLYRDYRGKGLEIVSLMFEHFGDFPRAAEATQRFRQHYGIEYTTLIAGISDKDEAARSCPCWTASMAFPTTDFHRPQGQRAQDSHRVFRSCHGRSLRSVRDRGESHPGSAAGGDLES
jgi:thiol-disulfide isomerase/thioredoxin